MKIIIIAWLAAGLFVDSVPPAPDGSKWKARFQNLFTPPGGTRWADSDSRCAD